MVRQTVFPYKVPSRGKECVAGGELFEPGETLVSTVKSNENGELFREDFCLDCWAKAKKKGKGPYWKNKQAAPKEKPQPSKDECALEVLRAHVDKKEIESKQYCYLLALYLERSRQFMLRKDLKKKKDALVYYEAVQTGEIFGILPVFVDTKIKEEVERLIDEISVSL